MAPGRQLHNEVMQAYEYLRAYERIEHMNAEEHEDLAFIADFVRQVENALYPPDDGRDGLDASNVLPTLSLYRGLTHVLASLRGHLAQ